MGMVGHFLVAIGAVMVVAIMFAPKISSLIGGGLARLLSPSDSVPNAEKIDLQPVLDLIDRDNYPRALAEVDALLQKQKPTHDALLIKTRILHHLGKMAETRALLPDLMSLSKNAEQQLAAMQFLPLLKESGALAAGIQNIVINHELVVFQMTGGDAPMHKVIPAGTHRIEAVTHRERHWLKLVNENWGNAAVWWEAVRKS